MGDGSGLFSSHPRSYSMAQLLFLVCFSEASLFPIGVAVVVIRSLLLTFVEWKGEGT